MAVLAQTWRLLIIRIVFEDGFEGVLDYNEEQERHGCTRLRCSSLIAIGSTLWRQH